MPCLTCSSLLCPPATSLAAPLTLACPLHLLQRHMQSLFYRFSFPCFTLFLCPCLCCSTLVQPVTLLQSLPFPFLASHVSTFSHNTPTVLYYTPPPFPSLVYSPVPILATTLSCISY